MKTKEELQAELNAEKSKVASLTEQLAKSTVLQDSRVQGYVLLLEKLLAFEVDVQRLLTREFSMLPNSESAAMYVYEKEYKQLVEPIRTKLNSKLTNTMHDALLDTYTI